MARSVKIRDRVDRSIARARMVETPEHLADAAQDAYFLAEEVARLRDRVSRMVREHNDGLMNLPRWKFEDWK